jgi:hypothetical protein
LDSAPKKGVGHPMAYIPAVLRRPGHITVRRSPSHCRTTRTSSPPPIDGFCHRWRGVMPHVRRSAGGEGTRRGRRTTSRPRDVGVVTKAPLPKKKGMGGQPRYPARPTTSPGWEAPAGGRLPHRGQFHAAAAWSHARETVSRRLPSKNKMAPPTPDRLGPGHSAPRVRTFERRRLQKGAYPSQFLEGRSI